MRHIEIPERVRRNGALALAASCWTATALLTALRATEILPMAMGSLVVFTIGVAITATMVRSRMRLTETIVKVFVAGMTAGETAAIRRAEKAREGPIPTRPDDAARVVEEAQDEIRRTRTRVAAEDELRRIGRPPEPPLQQPPQTPQGPLN